jgi:hypothetical protein
MISSLGKIPSEVLYILFSAKMGGIMNSTPILITPIESNVSILEKVIFIGICSSLFFNQKYYIFLFVFLIISFVYKFKTTMEFDLALNIIIRKQYIFGWKISEKKVALLSDFTYLYVKQGRSFLVLILFSTTINELILFEVDAENVESEAQRVADILGLPSKGLLTSNGFSR